MIFSIGHSILDISVFIDTIKKYEITILFDLRGIPFAKFAHQFNQPVLKRVCEENYIKYIHLNNLSGINVKKNYKPTKLMLEALNSIVEAAKSNKVVIMGANKDLNICHRLDVAELIGVYFNVEVLHIFNDKEAIMHSNIKKQLQLF